jgi:hypothetical protein
MEELCVLKEGGSRARKGIQIASKTGVRDDEMR